jgi:serine/threonine protein kinase
MSPEVAEHNSYNQGADVYSFGIVLSEILFLSYSGPRYENGLIDITWTNCNDAFPNSILNIMISCVSPVVESRPTMREVQNALRLSITELTTKIV